MLQFHLIFANTKKLTDFFFLNRLRTEKKRQWPIIINNQQSQYLIWGEWINIYSNIISAILTDRIEKYKKWNEFVNKYCQDSKTQIIHIFRIAKQNTYLNLDINNTIEDEAQLMK